MSTNNYNKQCDCDRKLIFCDKKCEKDCFFSIEESQEDMWSEAYKIYSRREHSDDSISDLKKVFTISRKSSSLP